MANRLVSNMYIIDSHQIARPLAYGTSDGILNTTTANVGKMRVMAVIFNALDTTARCQIALGNTANIVLDYQSTAATGTKPQVDHFGYGVPWQGVFIPTITAGTAVLVLE